MLVLSSSELPAENTVEPNLNQYVRDKGPGQLERNSLKVDVQFL
jgi:hypothetical protein